MEWRLIEQGRRMPKAWAETWPVVDKHSFLGGEIIDTYVCGPDGRYYRYGSWVTDRWAYEVQEVKDERA